MGRYALPLKSFLVGVVLIPLLAVFTILPVSVKAQPFTAQIQAFYNWLMNTPQHVNSTWTFTDIVVTGSCTGCGGGGGTIGGTIAAGQVAYGTDTDEIGGFGDWDGTILTVNALVASGPGIGTKAINSSATYEDGDDAGLDPNLFVVYLLGDGKVYTIGYGLNTGIAVGSSDGDISTADSVWGSAYEVDFGGSDTHIASMYGSQVITSGFSGAVVDNYWGFATQLDTSAAAITNLFAYWANDLADSATNPYYFWADSQGVLRYKEDGSHDSVGQAVLGFYNPLYPKYIPGAAFHERYTEFWDGNVLNIGTEAGVAVTLTSLTSSATTATATLVGMNPPDGASVTIAGANQAEYNGSYTITRIDADSFSYTFAGSATTPATGTITAQGGTVRPVRLLGTDLRAAALTTTGAASGKTVVCVDTSTGKLYASTSGVACAN